MKLWGLSDLHVGHADNRTALSALKPRPDDWLIVGGDVGETHEHLRFALDVLAPKFAKLIWIPGNHDLWTPRSEGTSGKRGADRYESLVQLCEERGVLTPEDAYPQWPAGDANGDPLFLTPMFLLYDYTFAPDDVGPDKAIAWAAEEGILCTDELLLHPDPYRSKVAWCHARCDLTEARLNALPAHARTVLINHFPLRRDVIHIPRVPRFIPWCGTRRTEDWHVRFRATVVVSGHLHVRTTQWRDGVRFEEISLGYPRQRRLPSDAEPYLREILPGPPQTTARYYP